MINYIPSQRTKKWLTSYVGDFFGNIINAFNLDLFSSRGKARNGKKIYPHTLESDITGITPPSSFTSANISDSSTHPRKIWAVGDTKKIVRSLASTLPLFTLDTGTGFDASENTGTGSDLLAVGDDSGEPIESIAVSTPTGTGAFSLTGSGDNTKWAQSFIAGGPLSSIQYYARKVGTPTGTYTVTIQEDTAGVPSGTPLISITKDATTLTTSFVLTTDEIASFTPTSYQLDLSKTYWMVFTRSVADTTNYLQFELDFAEASDPVVTPDPNDPYSDGQLLNYNGTTWTRLTTTTVVDTFTANGTWTCPAGVTSAIVEAWAAGAGGSTNVGAGGGGAYSLKTVTVVPTTGYTIAVGASGVNANGGDSTFATTTVVAKGGLSGTNGGTGGTAAAGTGDTKYSGGNASIGTGNRGGGGGAGDSGAGSAGTSGAGGAGGLVNGGGAGMSGGNGVPMGGGAGSQTVGGGIGGRGEVRVTYQIAATASYPVVRGRIWGRQGDGVPVTSRDITMPSAIVGELLLVVFSSYDNVTATASTGWTKLGQDSALGGDLTQAIFYKVAEGGDTLTVTTSTAQETSWVVLRLKDAGTPTATFANLAGGTNIDPPSHDALTSAKYLWLATASVHENTTVNISAAPSGYQSFVTENGNKFSATGVTSESATTAIAEKFAQAQTENPGVFTQATFADWVAATISIPYEVTSFFADASIAVNVEFPEATERLYLTTTTDVKFLNVENGVWQSLWQGICDQDPLDSAYPHPMVNLGAGGILLIGDGNNVHSVFATATDSSDATPNRLVFPNTHFVNWITVTKSAVFIGLQDNNSDLLPSLVVYYEPFSEVTRIYEIMEGATVGYTVNENCEIIDKSGQIRPFTGSDFRAVDYLPPYFSDQKVTTLPHRNAFVIKDGITRFLWEGEYPYAAGIWTRENDRLYHRNSLVFSKTTLNSYGAIEGASDWRALYWTGIDYVMGASVKNNSLATLKGIFSDKNIDASPVSAANRGNFKTSKFTSSGTDSTWQKIFAKLDTRRDGTQTGEIKLKYRVVNNPISEGENASTFTGTWTSTTTFTCATTQFKTDVDAGNIVVGNEVIVRTGQGAGLLAHITAIAGAVGATKTITIDEGLAAISSGSMTFSVENWTKTENKKMVGKLSEWEQVKCEIRGNVDLEELQVGEKANSSVDES